ncbi:MAG: DCC1-like thiol-disulfide oxidoreductase family protein [Actinomycetota bacterium]
MTVLFDDDCGFCRWSVSRLAVWDRHRRLRFEPIRSEAGDASLEGMDVAQRARSWHVVTRRGLIASAGAAMPFLLRELPAGAPLARLAETFPRSTDRAYQAIARRRDVLGRLLHVDACDAPTPR